MKRYKKEINGRTVIKIANDIVINKDGKQIINPTEEMILSDGWIEYIPPTPIDPTEEELLEQAKARKLERLYAFDESQEVDDCIIVYQGQELHYWAKKTERDVLKGTVRDFISLGRNEYRLDFREIGISLLLPCEALLGMLAQLEVYAADCYNKTTDHEFAIKALPTIEEVEEYKFTGYPEKLRFEV